jgi:DNA-binding CsgD family transcriptional regulator/tetratricopeptide (TPR) repeat protein
LDEEDVGGVIEQITGCFPSQPLAEAILQRTDGNPFFVIEIVRHLAAGGPRQAIDPNTPLVIPGNVRDAIRRRVSAISSDCRDLLETAAAIGRDFSVPVLAAASGRSTDDVIDLLDEASRAHITHETDAVGQSRFTHVLISETLAADLGTRRLMKKHASIAAAFELVHAAEKASYIDVIAHHYRMAAAIGFAPQAIDYSVAAARRAMGQAAWEKAIDHYQQALDVFELLPHPELTARCTLLLALGDAQNVEAGLFSSAAARATFEQAAELAFEVGDAELFARAAIGFDGINALTTTGGVRQVALLDEALSMLGPSDSVLKARVMGRLAASLMDRSLSCRDVPRARTLSDSSLAMARRIGDPVTLVNVLMMWHIAHNGPADTDKRLAAMQEAISVAEAAGERELLALAHELRCNDLLEMGAMAEFEHDLQMLHGIADELRLPLLRWSMLNRQAVREQSAGRYQRAENLVTELKDTRSLVGDRISYLKMFFLLREQGRLDEIAGDVRATLESSSQLYDLAFGLILDIDTGHLDEARLALEQVPVASYGRLEHDATWLLTLALHAEACHALDDGDRAGVLFRLLSPYAERNAGATGNLFLGAASRFLGLLATTRHEWEVAERQFRHAIDINTRLAMPAYVAHAQYAYAEMLTRRGVPVDHETVRALLDPVITTTRTLGMRPLHQRASALRESSTHPRSGAVVSSRERDVLCLIAEGRSNLEIAASLSISPHTVETHVTNILNKLGVESRTAAATWAVRRGIV